MATTLSPRLMTPRSRSCCTPATDAAEAGSQPMPAPSMTAFASRISASVTAATTPRVSRIARTARS